MTTREQVERHWSAANARNWEEFAALLAEDLLYTVPQTQERVIGREAYVEFFRTWPGEWRAEIVALTAEGDAAFCQIDFVTEGVGTEIGIAYFEIADGRIARITDFWPAPYEPPQRTTTAIERY